MRRIVRKAIGEWKRFQRARTRSAEWARRQTRVVQTLDRNPRLLVKLAEEFYNEAERRGFLVGWQEEQHPQIGRTVESISRPVIRTPEPIKQTIISIGSAAADWKRSNEEYRPRQIKHIIDGFNRIIGYYAPRWTGSYQNRFRNLTKATRENWQEMRAMRAALNDLGYRGHERNAIEYSLQIAGFFNPGNRGMTSYLRNTVFKDETFRNDIGAFIRQYKRYLHAQLKTNKR